MLILRAGVGGWILPTTPSPPFRGIDFYIAIWHCVCMIDLREELNRVKAERDELREWVTRERAEAEGYLKERDAARAERDEFEAAAQAKHCVHPGWITKAQQAEKLEARAERAEAANAALRAGLECVTSHHTYEDWQTAIEIAESLLASPAPGAELLAELERLRNSAPCWCTQVALASQCPDHARKEYRELDARHQYLREAARKAADALTAPNLWESRVSNALSALDAALGDSK